MKSKLFFAYKKATRVALDLIKIPEPKLISGSNSVMKIASEIRSLNLKSTLIITDRNLVKLGLLNELEKDLQANNIQYSVFDNVQPNPTSDSVDEAFKIYTENNFESIIAFGGGSPMDCAKAVGARVARPNKTTQQLDGMFKVLRKTPTLFAVPTTAGTGSECTLVAAITDSATHRKMPIADINLTPDYAILDPNLMLGLPPHITAATGMDALTHAVEAYISCIPNTYTNEKALEAIRIILGKNQLITAYNDGSNAVAREEMALASYYAGLAFSRSLLGYVHAIAHRMSELYNYPHGLANAIILPHVLKFHGEVIHPQLANLAIECNLGSQEETDEVLANRFIKTIEDLNKTMNIPKHIVEIKNLDKDLIVTRAKDEIKNVEAPPELLNDAQIRVLLRKISGR